MQLASIILKQYIESHWNTLSEKFQEPELQEKVICVGTTCSNLVVCVCR